MTIPQPIGDDVFSRLIDPVLFASSEPSTHPSLTLVAGQPGSGTASVVGQLAREHSDAVAFHVDELSAFHPDFTVLGRRHPSDAADLLSGPVDGWLAEALAQGLESRRSLVIGGTFEAETILGLTGSFGEAGFSTEVVLAGARRSDSLLSVLSAYVECRRLRVATVFVSRERHQRGWDATSAVATTLEQDLSVDRVRVVDRIGNQVFAAGRSAGQNPAGLSDALDELRHATWTPRAAAEWLGELRRVGERVRELRELGPEVADVLLELQLLALHEVLPDLPVRSGSPVSREQERRIGTELVELRKIVATAVAEPVSTPLVAPEPEFVPEPPRVDGPSL